MMIDRIQGNQSLKQSLRLQLAGRRLSHSLLLVGEQGLGAGFAARCVAADYLYPAGGPPAQAMVRGQCCRAVGKSGRPFQRTHRDRHRPGGGVGGGDGRRRPVPVSQVQAMRAEIFNTSLSAEGRAVLLYHVERMNEESANALLKVMEEPPEGVLFLLRLPRWRRCCPTIRSRCVSFALAPVEPDACAQYCAAQGVAQADAALYSALFDGRIGTVLSVAQNKERRRAQLDQALTLARAAAASDAYPAAVLLAGYEKDKAAAAALLTDLLAVAAAGLRNAPSAPVQGDAARRTLAAASQALERLAAQVSPKAVLSVLAIKLGRI